LPDLRIADAVDPDVALIALTPDDLPRIAGWLRTPNVARWWNHPPESGLAEIAAHLDDPLVAPFRAEAAGRPVGYLQIYHANPEPFWAGHDLPRETFGLDLFIGEADALELGWGPRFIALALRRLFAMPAVARVHIDPDPENAVAIRAYEKAGFRRVGPIDTPDGLALYMTIERDARER
jgi:aminoglycoside 6'-N-acetyltransferase